MVDRGARRPHRILVVCSFAVALLAGAWLGVAGARVLATSSEPLTRFVLSPSSLYRLGTRALVLDITNSDFLAGVNRGPLQVTEADVTRILHATYDTTDTSAKAAEVHAALLEFVSRDPGDRIFRVSIAAERPVLADSLGRVLLDQYRSLPDCGLGDDLGALLSAGRVRFFGGSGEEFFNESHPDCRPPDVVASRVEEALREEIRSMSETGPDSVDAFPEEPGDPGFAETVDQFQRGLRWSSPLWPLLLFGAAALPLAAVSLGTLGVPASGLGAGLLLYGGVATLLGPSRVARAFAGAGTVGEASEVWASLGRYGFHRVLMVSGTWSAIIGLALVLASLTLATILRRRRGALR